MKQTYNLQYDESGATPTKFPIRISSKADLARAANYLDEHAAAQQQKIDLNYVFNIPTIEVGHALHNVLQKRGLFKLAGSGAKPEKYSWKFQGKTYEDFRGPFTIPNCSGSFQLHDSVSMCVFVANNIKQCDTQHFNELVSDLETELKTFRLFSVAPINWNVQGGFLPEEMKISNEQRPIVSQSINSAFDILDQILAAPDKLKKGFGVLLSGTYGTGKTMYARYLANRTLNSPWSFFNISGIDARHYSNIETLYSIAQQSSPAIIFMEDIERLEHRAADLSLLLDGIRSKGSAVLSIFSTNHEEQIPKVLRRAGRIDFYLRMPLLAANTAAKMLEGYGISATSNELSPFMDLPPSFVDSAYRQAMMLEEKPSLQTLVGVTELMRPGLEFLNGQENHVLTPGQKIEQGMRQILKERE